MVGNRSAGEGELFHMQGSQALRLRQVPVLEEEPFKSKHCDCLPEACQGDTSNGCRNRGDSNVH